MCRHLGNFCCILQICHLSGSMSAPLHCLLLMAYRSNILTNSLLMSNSANNKTDRTSLVESTNMDTVSDSHLCGNLFVPQLCPLACTYDGIAVQSWNGFCDSIHTVIVFTLWLLQIVICVHLLCILGKCIFIFQLSWVFVFVCAYNL